MGSKPIPKSFLISFFSNQSHHSFIIEKNMSKEPCKSISIMIHKLFHSGIRIRLNSLCSSLLFHFFLFFFILFSSFTLRFFILTAPFFSLDSLSFQYYFSSTYFPSEFFSLPKLSSRSNFHIFGYSPPSSSSFLQSFPFDNTSQLRGTRFDCFQNINKFNPPLSTKNEIHCQLFIIDHDWWSTD